MIASVSTWSVHEFLLSGKLSYEDFVKKVKNLGTVGVEIVDIDFQDTSLEAMKKLKKISDENNVQITCMSIENDLCQLSEEDRQNEVEKVLRWMRTSKMLGVRNVRIFTGWHKPMIPYSEQIKWVYEGLATLSEKAKVLNLDLVLENHDDVCLGADEILAMFDRIGSKHLYTCPDVFNYKRMAGTNMPIIDDRSFEEIEKLLPLAKNVHVKICEAVKNNTEDKYLDIPRMISMLKSVNYDGPVALEFMWPYLKNTNKDPIEEFENAVKVIVYQCQKAQ